MKAIDITECNPNEWDMIIHTKQGGQVIIEHIEDKYPDLLTMLLDINKANRPPEEEALEKALEVVVQTASAEQLAQIKDVFPIWEKGGTIEVGKIIRHKESLYRCVIEHTFEYPPDIKTSLWANIGVDEATGAKIIDWYKPTADRYYSFGQFMRYTDGNVYKSLLAVNTWSPDEYPNGWELMEVTK